MTDIFHSQFVEARRGNAEAREWFVCEFGERLKRFIERHMGQDARRRAEPDDVFQSTFLSFFSRIGTYPENLAPEEALAFLLQTAKWRIADLLKHADVVRGESHMPISVAVEPVSSGPVTRNDERQWTAREIAELPELYRRVLLLYYRDGLSADEVGRRESITTDAVKQRLVRGRELLRERWREKDGRHDE